MIKKRPKPIKLSRRKFKKNRNQSHDVIPANYQESMSLIKTLEETEEVPKNTKK